MTPREIAHVLRLAQGDIVAPPQRPALEALMAMFPDMAKRNGQ